MCYNFWYFDCFKIFVVFGCIKGFVLINEMFFQYNIIEFGVYWVDSLWCLVNNINNIGFIELLFFIGDMIKFVDEFYDVMYLVWVLFYCVYICQCLVVFVDQFNVIYMLSEEYIGLFYFMQFWFDVVGEWMCEIGKCLLFVFSVMKDVQDVIFVDYVCV